MSHQVQPLGRSQGAIGDWLEVLDRSSSDVGMLEWQGRFWFGVFEAGIHGMSRRLIYPILLFATFWVGPDRDLTAASRYNIVLIYADDLGYGDLACHGHPHILTPHIDRLAAEGTDFQSFTVVNPVCSPSRTGIMTGQFPSRWGVHQHFASHQQNVERNMPDWLDPQAPLLSRILKEAGYTTGHFGKWHLSGGGIADAPLPAAYGFDDAAVWTGPGKHVFEGTAHQQMLTDNAPHHQEAASWISAAATDHAIRFIRKAGPQPFFVNLWLHETHHLVSATPADKAIYPDIDEPHRTYYGAVSRADRQVGRILNLLDELNVANDTLVIFSSDNGPENTHLRPGQKFYFSVGSTGGLRGRKRSLLLGGVNTPFLIRLPGVVPAGRVDRETALSGVDVPPTVLALTGVSTPNQVRFDGQNMLPAFQGTNQPRSQPLFWYWPGHHGGDDWPAYAMRVDRWMLLWDETQSRSELYDVVDDREQLHDLSAVHPDRVRAMQQSIKNWIATLPTHIDSRLQSKAAAAATPSTRSPDRARVFTRWDRNRDGQLTLSEYRDGLSSKANAEQRFNNFDTNQDGVLSREEFVGNAR